jgi:hypothetical protein
VESLTVVSLVFGVVIISGIGLIAYLWNAYNNLQVENDRLQAQITTLLRLLEHYLSAEKQAAVSPFRRDLLEEILSEVRNLQRQGPRGDWNVTNISGGSDVGQVSGGRGTEQTRTNE